MRKIAEADIEAHAVEKKRKGGVLENIRVAVCSCNLIGPLHVFPHVLVARDAIYNAEPAHPVAVYQRAAAFRAATFEIDFSVALALLFLYCAGITLFAKTEAERVFSIILFERSAASSAQHMLRPFG